MIVIGMMSAALAQTCVEPPDDMLGWWPGDGNTNDIQGTNDGTWVGEASYDPGVVGLAFSVEAEDGHVVVPHDDSLAVGDGELTVDFWVRLSPEISDLEDRLIVGKYDPFTDVGFALSHQGDAVWGCLNIAIYGSAGIHGW
jgi:hypothetical protein